MADRNCTECKHHVPLKPGSDIYGCEKWECEFEPKEERRARNDENTDNRNGIGRSCQF